MRKLWVIAIATLLILAGTAWALAWSGLYDVAADRPHTALVHSFLNTLRAHSIERHAHGIEIPSLDDPRRIAEGAEHYAAMCTGCHLAPGLPDTDIRQGLLPQPPNLSKHDVTNTAQTFWVIKHGIKATAMPAWGKTHDDEEIWNLVAFLKRLPRMTPAQYRAATESHNEAGSTVPAHEHGHEQSHHEHGD